MFCQCSVLVAANNSTIHTYGNCKRVVDVGLKREYPWTFIVADVQQPIIGADFLIHYNLLVDLRSRCLRDMRTGLAIAASLSSIKPLSLNRVDTVQNEYTKLLGQFPELTRPTTKGSLNPATVSGPQRFTWCQRKTAIGDHAGTTVVWMHRPYRTVIRFLIYKISCSG